MCEAPVFWILRGGCANNAAILRARGSALFQRGQVYIVRHLLQESRGSAREPPLASNLKPAEVAPEGGTAKDDVLVLLHLYVRCGCVASDLRFVSGAGVDRAGKSYGIVFGVYCEHRDPNIVDGIYRGSVPIVRPFGRPAPGRTLDVSSNSQLESCGQQEKRLYLSNS